MYMHIFLDTLEKILIQVPLVRMMNIDFIVLLNYNFFKLWFMVEMPIPTIH